MKMKYFLLRMKPSLLRIKFELNIEYNRIQERILLCRILRLRRVASATNFPSAAVRSCPEGFFYFIGDFIEISYEIKKGSANPFDTLCIFDLQILFLFSTFSSHTLIIESCQTTKIPVRPYFYFKSYPLVMCLLLK